MNTSSTPEFEDWFNGLTRHQENLVITRLGRIRESNHFGVVRPLGDELFELKWKNGLRVYSGTSKTTRDKLFCCCWEGIKMTKAATSQKRAPSWLGKPRKLRPGADVRDFDPTSRLLDPAGVRASVLQALSEGDYESVVDLVVAHLSVLNRTRSAKTMGISRPYLHKLLRASTEPSLPTFVKFMHLLNEEQAAKTA